MTRILLALPFAGLLLTPLPALAQANPPSQPPSQTNPDAPESAQPKASGCVDVTTSVVPGNNAAATAESETQPVRGPDAGTAPGGAGSSGWTGGLGGSDIGTSQSKEQATAPAQPDHPKVASGLDPISGETKVRGPQAPGATIDTDAAAKPAAPAASDSAAAKC